MDDLNRLAQQVTDLISPRQTITPPPSPHKRNITLQSQNSSATIKIPIENEEEFPKFLKKRNVQQSPFEAKADTWIYQKAQEKQDSPIAFYCNTPDILIYLLENRFSGANTQILHIINSQYPQNGTLYELCTQTHTIQAPDESAILHIRILAKLLAEHTKQGPELRALVHGWLHLIHSQHIELKEKALAMLKELLPNNLPSGLTTAGTLTWLAFKSKDAYIQTQANLARAHLYATGGIIQLHDYLPSHFNTQKLNLPKDTNLALSILNTCELNNQQKVPALYIQGYIAWSKNNTIEAFQLFHRALKVIKSEGISYPYLYDTWLSILNKGVAPQKQINQLILREVESLASDNSLAYLFLAQAHQIGFAHTATDSSFEKAALHYIPLLQKPHFKNYAREQLIEIYTQFDTQKWALPKQEAELSTLYHRIHQIKDKASKTDTILTLHQLTLENKNPGITEAQCIIYLEKGHQEDPENPDLLIALIQAYKDKDKPQDKRQELIQSLLKNEKQLTAVQVQKAIDIITHTSNESRHTIRNITDLSVHIHRLLVCADKKAEETALDFLKKNESLLKPLGDPLNFPTMDRVFIKILTQLHEAKIKRHNNQLEYFRAILDLAISYKEYLKHDEIARQTFSNIRDQIISTISNQKASCKTTNQTQLIQDLRSLFLVAIQKELITPPDIEAYYEAALSLSNESNHHLSIKAASWLNNILPQCSSLLISSEDKTIKDKAKNIYIKTLNKLAWHYLFLSRNTVEKPDETDTTSITQKSLGQAMDICAKSLQFRHDHGLDTQNKKIKTILQEIVRLTFNNIKIKYPIGTQDIDILLTQLISFIKKTEYYKDTTHFNKNVSIISISEEEIKDFTQALFYIPEKGKAYDIANNQQRLNLVSFIKRHLIKDTIDPEYPLAKYALSLTEQRASHTPEQADQAKILRAEMIRNGTGTKMNAFEALSILLTVRSHSMNKEWEEIFFTSFRNIFEANHSEDKHDKSEVMKLISKIILRVDSRHFTLLGRIIVNSSRLSSEEIIMSRILCLAGLNTHPTSNTEEDSKKSLECLMLGYLLAANVPLSYTLNQEKHELKVNGSLINIFDETYLTDEKDTETKKSIQHTNNFDPYLNSFHPYWDPALKITFPAAPMSTHTPDPLEALIKNSTSFCFSLASYVAAKGGYIDQKPRQTLINGTVNFAYNQKAQPEEKLEVLLFTSSFLGTFQGDPQKDYNASTNDLCTWETLRLLHKVITECQPTPFVLEKQFIIANLLLNKHFTTDIDDFHISESEKLEMTHIESIQLKEILKFLLDYLKSTNETPAATALQRLIINKIQGKTLNTTTSLENEFTPIGE